MFFASHTAARGARKRAQQKKAARPPPAPAVVGDIVVEGVRAFNLGNRAWQEGKRRRALALYSQAINSHPQDVTFYVNRANAFFEMNLYQGSLEDAEKAIEADRFNWRGYYHKSMALFYMNSYSRAEKAALEGLQYFLDCEHLHLVLAGIYFTVNMYGMCIQRARHVLRLNGVEDRSCQASFLILGLAYSKVFQAQTLSFSFLYNCQKLQTTVEKDEDEESLASDDYGDKILPDQMQSEMRAVNIVREIEAHMDELVELGQRAILHDQEVPKAVEYWHNCLLIARLMGNTVRQGDLQSRLAAAYRTTGEYDKSLEAHMKAIDLAPEETAKSYSGIGNTYFSMGSYKKSLEYHIKHLHTEVAAKNEVGMGTAYNNIACVQFVLGRFGAAIDHYTRYLQICEVQDDPIGMGTAMNNIGNCYIHTKQLEQARVVLTAALENHVRVYEHTLKLDPKSATQKGRLLQQVRTTYKLVTETYMRAYDFDTALAWSERGKVRSFVDPLSEVFVQEEVMDPGVEEIRDFARDTGTTVVSYTFVSRSRMNIWVVRPEDRRVEHRLVQWPSDLHFDPQEFAALLEGQSEREARSDPIEEEEATERSNRRLHMAKIALAKLYDVLILPINTLLPPRGADMPVLIAPQGPLYAMPFAALYNDKRKRFFVEERPFAVSLNLATTLFNHERRRQACEGLWKDCSTLKAGVVFDQTVTDGRNEGTSVADALKVTALNGSEVSLREARACMEGKRVVHVICRKTTLPKADFSYTADASAQVTSEKTISPKDVTATMPGDIYFLKDAGYYLRSNSGLLSSRISKDSVPAMEAMTAFRADPQFYRRAERVHKDTDCNSLQLAELHHLDLEGTELITINSCNPILEHNGHLSDMTSMARHLFAAGAQSTILSLWPCPDTELSVRYWSTFYELYYASLTGMGGNSPRNNDRYHRKKREASHIISCSLIPPVALSSLAYRTVEELRQSDATSENWTSWVCWQLYL